MPYIITTYAEVHDWGLSTSTRTRRAVPTLDEARERVACTVGDYDAGDFNAHCRADAIDEQVAALSESGGIVGALPDGTVIEVKRVCWGWVIGCADDLGIDTDLIHDNAPSGQGDRAILDAYNAAQEG